MGVRKRPIIALILNIILIFAHSVAEIGAAEKSTRPLKHLRISEQKCKDYKELYRIIYRSTLVYPHNQDTFGPLWCPRFQEKLIVGGRDAKPYEFPHMASLMYRLPNGTLSHGCGGTLISENFILTAAHCIDTVKGPPARVMLGDISLEVPVQRGRTNYRGRSKRKQIFVKRTYVHPKYNPKGSGSAYHDIALIELSQKVNFERRAPDPIPIRPACLPQPNQFNTLDKVGSAGWGRLGTYQKEPHNILQAVELTVQDLNSCTGTYQENQIDFRVKFPHQITSNQICAGDIGKDTCAGDSGGPITVFQKSMPCMHYVVGVTSLGHEICGSGVPAIYTRVDQYLDWIESTVWKSST